MGGTWSTTAITWSVLGLRRNIVPGTSATRMPTIRNANGTRLRRSIVEGTLTMDRSIVDITWYSAYDGELLAVP